MKKQRTDEEMMWKKLSSEYIIQRPWLTARCDKVELPNGTIHDEYYVLEYPTWINVVAETEEGMLVLERQYRHGLQIVSTETCAGCVEEGETPLEAAKRELEEETGYIGKLKKIGVIYTTPGFCDETIYLYMAEQLIKTKQHLDENEYLDVISIPIKKVFQMISEGKIQDAKTLSAFSIARDYLYEK